MARGRRNPQVSMLAFIDLEERVPVDHPIRAIKRMADGALAELSPLFDAMYADTGRPSIPPERLLKAELLIALFSVRSERALCADLDYNLLYRWFLDMNLMEPSFDPSSFSKNRARLVKHEVAARFFAAVGEQAKTKGLLSDEHFTVDGTLIEAAASLKSFRPREVVTAEAAVTVATESTGGLATAEPAAPPAPGCSEDDDDPGNRTVNFRGERRSNATHQSTTDPEARLAKKSAGKEAKLSYGAHALMENRHGLLVDFQITTATGTGERDVVPALLEAATARGLHPRTLGADKGYDTKACVAELQSRGVAPHVTRNVTTRRSSAIDDETTRQPGYVVSQRKRKLVEEIFGWMKTVGGFRRTRYRGLERTQLAGYLVGAAYNLVRMSRLEQYVGVATSG
jgi:transposase